MAVADQHPAALGQGVGGQGADEPRLADARLAHHGGNLSLPPDGLVEPLAQPPELRLPPEQRRLRRGESRWRRPDLPRGARAMALLSVGSRHHLGRPTKQVLIEVLRLRLGRCPQLPLQHADAHLVLLERGPPTPLAGIEPHERAVRGLLQGIEPEQTHRRLDGALGGRGLGLFGQ